MPKKKSYTEYGIVPTGLMRTNIKIVRKGKEFYHPYFSKRYWHKFYKLHSTIFQVNAAGKVIGYMLAGPNPEKVFGLIPVEKDDGAS